MTESAGTEAVEPFHVAVPEDRLNDLRGRLERTRWAEALPGSAGSPAQDWDYGTPVSLVGEQVAYWLDSYDWRAWERRLNAYPQFTTRVDGTTVHFLHVPSAEPGARPAVLTHGWPGTVFEFIDVVEALTDPRAHGGDPAAALHLVVPSLPGFAFSGPTVERGWGPRRIADAWAALMSRLGYEQFIAIGNDWGAEVSLELARRHPARVRGAHVTQMDHALPDVLGLQNPTAQEREAIGAREWFEENMSAYQRLLEQQPASLAHALADSPAGLLAWYDVVFRGGVDHEIALTHASTTWLTGTVASSLRIYREWYLEAQAGVGARSTPEPTRVPVALAQFARDIPAIRRLAEREHSNIVAWNVYEVGSHWAARDAPTEWVADVQGFVTGLD